MQPKATTGSRVIFSIADDKPHGFSIGKVARHSGVKVETIRYYERIGLLSPPPRTGGGHRLYGRAEVKRLNFVRRARELGFTLGQVRDLLALADGREGSCAKVEKLARAQLDATRGRIADLERMETVLADMVARCAAGTVPTCPILDALSEERG